MVIILSFLFNKEQPSQDMNAPLRLQYLQLQAQVRPWLPDESKSTTRRYLRTAPTTRRPREVPFSFLRDAGGQDYTVSAMASGIPIRNSKTSNHVPLGTTQSGPNMLLACSVRTWHSHGHQDTIHYCFREKVIYAMKLPQTATL